MSVATVFRSCISAAALGLAAHCATAAAAVSTADFFMPRWSGGVIDNRAFTPTAAAKAAHAPFIGRLMLVESEMATDPAALSSRDVLGRDPKLFPGAALAFFTHGGDLVPFTQDLIRVGSAARGRSYWDILVQPGRVWSEAADGDWSRAAFPFALVNSIEGETHNGVATFLYKRGRVSKLRLQIVQQTAPFYVRGNFTAAALVPAKFAAADAEAVPALTRLYESSLADAVHMGDWKELSAKVGADRLEGFDGTMPEADIVLSGLDFQGTFYLKECRSAAGPLPWCDRARFGVWSATKALINETALLRLAQKYGAGVFDLKIKDYVPEAAGYPG